MRDRAVVVVVEVIGTVAAQPTQRPTASENQRLAGIFGLH